MVLVPATMELLGDANWWLPRWLDRILPTIHVEASDHDDEPDPAGATGGTTSRCRRRRRTGPGVAWAQGSPKAT